MTLPKDRLPILQVPEKSLEGLEELASITGETSRNYILGSLELVWMWGSMINACDFPPELHHGVVDITTNHVIQIDIPGALERHPKQSDPEEAFDAYATRSGLRVPIPIDLLPEIYVASTYFDTTVQQLARYAINIRSDVLTRLDNCGVYVFSADQEQWLEARVRRVLCDPTSN